MLVNESAIQDSFMLLLLHNHIAKLTALSSTFQNNRGKQGYRDVFFFFLVAILTAIHYERKNTMGCASLD